MTQCVQFESKYKQQKKSLNEVKESYEAAAQLLALSKENETKASKKLSLLKDEIYACTSIKNNLLSVKKPSSDEKEELLQKKKEEKALLEKHDKAFSQRNEFMLKLENARVGEKSRLKQLEMQKRLMTDLEKKGEELYAQQDNIFSAIAKALIFR